MKACHHLTQHNSILRFGLQTKSWQEAIEKERFKTTKSKRIGEMWAPRSDTHGEFRKLQQQLVVKLKKERCMYIYIYIQLYIELAVELALQRVTTGCILDLQHTLCKAIRVESVQGALPSLYHEC